MTSTTRFTASLLARPRLAAVPAAWRSARPSRRLPICQPRRLSLACAPITHLRGARQRTHGSPAGRTPSSGASMRRATWSCSNDGARGRPEGRAGVLRPARLRARRRRTIDREHPATVRTVRLDQGVRGRSEDGAGHRHLRLRHHRDRRLPGAVRRCPRCRWPSATRNKPDKTYGRVMTGQGSAPQLRPGRLLRARSRHRPGHQAGRAVRRVSQQARARTCSSRTCSSTSWAKRLRWTCKKDRATLKVTMSRDAFTEGDLVAMRPE